MNPRPGDHTQETTAGRFSFPRAATTTPIVSLSRTDVLLIALVLEHYAQESTNWLTRSARRRAEELAEIIGSELLK